MNKKVKAKWLAALRSGEYKQTRGVLQDENGHCCLGVLCEVAVKEGVIPAPVKEEEGTSHSSLGSHDRMYRMRYGKEGGRPFSGDTTTLPKVVSEWAGMDMSNPEVRVDGERVKLTQLNDGVNDKLDGRLTFKQIADAIEVSL